MKPYHLLVPCLLVLASCPPAVSPSPNPPPDTDQCSVMCAHLQALKCEEGEPLYNNDIPGPKGVPNQSCTDNCTELQKKGLFLNPRCVATAPDCKQVEEYRLKLASDCVPK